MKHLCFYIFVWGWIFFYWCSSRSSKLSSTFCRYFKLDFKRVPQYCFKEVFLIISHFLTDLSEYVYVFFFFLIDSLVLIEMLFKFMKKDILNGGKLTCFLFPFCLTWCCWGLEAEKEHYIRNVWSWEWNVGHCAHSCRPPDGNKPFTKKTWKEMTIVL